MPPDRAARSERGLATNKMVGGTRQINRSSFAPPPSKKKNPINTYGKAEMI